VVQGHTPCWQLSRGCGVPLVLCSDVLWGFQIGVMVMVHSDDKGLVLPPRGPRASHRDSHPLQGRGAPRPSSRPRRTSGRACGGAGVRAKEDPRDNYSPGWKYNYWELKGVPLRVELGPRDLQNKTV